MSLSDDFQTGEDFVKSTHKLATCLNTVKVKKFIQSLKEEFKNNDWENKTLDVAKNRNKIIDKLAGEKLI